MSLIKLSGLKALALFLIIGIQSLSGWNSDLVNYDSSGRLQYFLDSSGNRIVDFSYAGYRNSQVAIPDIPVVMTISPVSGDNTAHIQNAINSVESMTPDANGFKGALLLSAGIYPVSGLLRIDASGVVLRGEGDGSDTTSNTVIFATGNVPSQRIVIEAGGGAVSLWGYNQPQPQVDITSDTVKAGDRRFQVADPSSFNVGDNIIIIHPCTNAWLEAIDYGGTHSGEGSWEPGIDLPWEVNSTPLYFNRNIVAIDGNTVTIDAPVYNDLIRALSQSYIYTWDRDGLVTNIGIENLRIDIENSGGSDEEHAKTAIVFHEIEDAWVRNCTALHFSLSGFETGMATRVTVENCNALDPVSVIEGGKRYNFSLYRYSQLVLYKDCHATNGRHHYISNGASSTSGCVFLDCTSSGAYASSEPHRRWSQGILYDNLVELDGPRPGVNPRLLGLYNRGYYGTSHGWGATNSVAWNCDVANGDLIVQQPPQGQNYAIGCSGNNVTGIRPPASFDEPEGYIEGINTSGLEPRSIFIAQLTDRQNPLPAYTLNLDLDGDGSLTVLPEPVNGLYDSSTVVTITASAAGHWHFRGWTGDATGNDNPLTIQINSDVSITADFDSITTHYTLDLLLSGSGEVSHFPEATNGIYDSSAVVQLTAMPSPHWEFSQWSGDVASQVNPLTVIMDSSIAITAEFDTITAQYSLDVTIDGNGTVTLDPLPINDTYDTGQVVRLTAQPDFAWEFLRWTGDLSSYTSLDSIIMTSNKSVTAFFEEIPVGQMVIDSTWDIKGAVDYVNSHDLVDTLILATAGDYVFTGTEPIRVLSEMTIMAGPGLSNRPRIRHDGTAAMTGDLIRVFAPLRMSGISIDGQSPSTPILHNGIHLINETNLQVTPGIDVTIIDCEFVNFHGDPDVAAMGHAFRIGVEVSAGSIRFENSLFRDIASSAVDISETQNWDAFQAVDSLTIRNCTFSGIGAECVNLWSDDLPFSADAPVLLEHLTIYESAHRSVLLVYSNNAVVRDIIITNSRSTPLGSEDALMTISGTGTTVSHIDTFQVAPLSFLVAGGVLDHSTIYGFDPLFADPETGDFTLLEGSPAYGIAHDGWALGDTRWASNPPVAVEDQGFNAIPREYSLGQNYPNPFNGRTFLQFSLPEKCQAVISVYDIQGRFIGEILNAELAAGRYQAGFESFNLPSGIYLYRLNTGNFQQIRKMTLIK